MDFLSNEATVVMEAELEDPNGPIDTFSQYLYQNDDWSHHSTSQQDIEDLFNSPSGIQHSGFDVVPYSAVNSQFQLAVQEALTPDNIQGQILNNQEPNTPMILNNENQIVRDQVGVQLASPFYLADQEVIPSFGTVSWENFQEINQFPPVIVDLKQEMNPSVAGIEDNKCVQNNSAMNPVCIKVSGQNNMETQSTHPGPMRNRVGRTPKDETPLYLQPEPENILEKRKWRRARTAYEHRMSKKNALVDNAQKIEDLMKEMNELKSKLQVVTAERDAYKDTVNNLSRSGNIILPRMPTNFV